MRAALFFSFSAASAVEALSSPVPMNYAPYTAPRRGYPVCQCACRDGNCKWSRAAPPRRICRRKFLLSFGQTCCKFQTPNCVLLGDKVYVSQCAVFICHRETSTAVTRPSDAEYLFNRSHNPLQPTMYGRSFVQPHKPHYVKPGRGGEVTLMLATVRFLWLAAVLGFARVGLRSPCHSIRSNL